MPTDIAVVVGGPAHGVTGPIPDDVDVWPVADMELAGQGYPMVTEYIVRTVVHAFPGRLDDNVVTVLIHPDLQCGAAAVQWPPSHVPLPWLLVNALYRGWAAGQLPADRITEPA